MSYDVKCYDLALVFLGDFTDAQLPDQRSKVGAELAQEIQDCIEVFLAEKGLES